MNQGSGRNTETRFAAYVQGLSSVLGHADRIGPLREYCAGPILPGERRSVEPMAATTAPARTAAQHQSLLHFVGVATWSLWHHAARRAAITIVYRLYGER
jgi:SRSO17 transposase